MTQGHKVTRSQEYWREEGAQSAIEFAFCMVAMVLIFYGCVMIFRWAGVGLAERKMAHEEALTQEIGDGWVNGKGPLGQVQLDYYIPDNLNFVFRKPGGL